MELYQFYTIIGLFITSFGFLYRKIDLTNKSLNDKIDSVNKSLNDKIDSVNKTLTEKIQTLDSRLSRVEGILSWLERYFTNSMEN